MRKSIFKEGRRYTFSDYFEMNNPTDEIVAEFGYSYSLTILDLPQSFNFAPESIENLEQTFLTVLPKISLTSEIAKRDFLIAPILLEIAKISDSKINVEYPLEIDDRLNGSIDYLIRAKQNLIVIEAKKGDLDKGFNQLAAEMIALDKYEEDSRPILYGAITVGNFWSFGILQRPEKRIARDIFGYSVPGDTAKIFSILLGIIELQN